MPAFPANSEPLGSRKRKVPIDDNGDMVTLAKKRTQGTKKSIVAIPSTTRAAKKLIKVNKLTFSSSEKRGKQQASVVEVFDVRDHSPSPSHSPRNPQSILEDNDPAKDVDTDKGESSGEEKEEEDAEAELGLFSSFGFKIPSNAVIPQ